jgi:circadian clock protein KaiC
MTARVRTGVQGLDEILGGGIVPGHSVLLEGRSGTGKSILGMQFLVAGAGNGEPGVLLTFDVKPERLYRDAANFGWDLKRLEKEGMLKVVLASPTDALDQLQTAGSALDKLLKKMHARRIVLDSVTMLRDLITARQDFRQVSMAAVNALSREELTSILIAETNSLFPAPAVIRSSVDAIVSLSAELYDHRDYAVRRIRVQKARGQDFIGGNHTFKIVSGAGIDVYPRVGGRSEWAADVGEVASSRDSFGIASLDEMLGGGTFAGSSTMVAGSTGTGKSLLGLHFVLAGIKAGEKVLIVNMEETVEQIVRNAQTLGFDLRREIQTENLRIIYRRPAELDLNEHVAMIAREVRAGAIRRVLIDSMSSYVSAARNDIHFKDVIVSLMAFLKGSRVSSVFTNEISELTAPSSVTENAVSTFVDNILLLRYFQAENRIGRAIMVLKSRGGDHSKTLREFSIGKGGLHIGEIDPGRIAPLFSFH